MQARDAYYECLDSAPGARRQARRLRKDYEAACPKSWVAHFDKKREEDDKFKKLLTVQTKPQSADAAA